MTGRPKLCPASAEPGRPAIPYGPVAVKAFLAFPRAGTENDKARVIETSLRRFSRPRAKADPKVLPLISIYFPRNSSFPP